MNASISSMNKQKVICESNRFLSNSDETFHFFLLTTHIQNLTSLKK